MTTCYTGCTPPTTIIHDAPKFAHHLAFTGVDVSGWIVAGIACIMLGLGALFYATRSR